MKTSILFVLFTVLFCSALVSCGNQKPTMTRSIFKNSPYNDKSIQANHSLLAKANKLHTQYFYMYEGKGNMSKELQEAYKKDFPFNALVISDATEGEQQIKVYTNEGVLSDHYFSSSDVYMVASE